MAVIKYRHFSLATQCGNDYKASFMKNYVFQKKIHVLEIVYICTQQKDAERRSGMRSNSFFKRIEDSCLAPSLLENPCSSDLVPPCQSL